MSQVWAFSLSIQPYGALAGSTSPTTGPSSATDPQKVTEALNSKHSIMAEAVAIFWDYENCPVPSGVSGCVVANKISSLMGPFGSIIRFRAYLEKKERLSSTRSLTLRSELQSSGVSLVDCPHNGRKDVADKMILVDMLAFAIDFPAPSTIVLITGDRDFAYGISTLKLRRYRVILITLPNAHTTLTSQASVGFDWVKDVINPSTNHTSEQPGEHASRAMEDPSSTPHSSSEESVSPALLLDPDERLNSNPDCDQSPSTPSSQSSQSRMGSPSCDDSPGLFVFLPLLKVLESYRMEGRHQPLRSRVASDLIKEDPEIYRNAGVNGFKGYISMAEKEEVVTLGGIGGHAWVSFKSPWN